MTHAYHDNLPGFSPKQVMHDGCHECEARSQNADHGIATLDPARFARAWARAAEWKAGRLSDAARVEVPLLQVLAAVQVQLSVPQVLIAVGGAL